MTCGSDNQYSGAKRDERGRCAGCGNFFGDWASVILNDGIRYHTKCIPMVGARLISRKIRNRGKHD